MLFSASIYTSASEITILFITIDRNLLYLLTILIFERNLLYRPMIHVKSLNLFLHDSACTRMYILYKNNAQIIILSTRIKLMENKSHILLKKCNIRQKFITHSSFLFEIILFEQIN